MGATGFVGRALVPALVDAGYEIRATTRNLARVTSVAHVEWVQCDVNQPRDLERALEGVDALFFLVHAMGRDADDYAETERRTALESVAVAKGVRETKGRGERARAARLPQKNYLPTALFRSPWNSRPKWPVYRAPLALRKAAVRKKGPRSRFS
jgi:uncharacterized protein YbjT (DUF2867 family)